MDDMFKGYLPEGERPDVQIYIFPHLQEFITIDLREEAPEVSLLHTDQVFVDDFFETVEKEFSLMVREDNPHPFAHLINLPLRLEEIIRGVAMNFVLERMGIDADDEENVPSIVVFVISGGALAMHSEKLVETVRDLLGTVPERPAVAQWEEVLARLVREENDALQEMNQQELAEAFNSESPDYFSLWENRN